jgi:hypothetical protein
MPGSGGALVECKVYGNIKLRMVQYRLTNGDDADVWALYT